MRKLFILLSMVFFYSNSQAQSPGLCNMKVNDVASINLSWSSITQTSSLPLQLGMKRYGPGVTENCNFFSYGFNKGNSSSYKRYLMGKKRQKIFYNLYNSVGRKNVLLEMTDARQDSDALVGRSPSINTLYSSSFDFKLQATGGAIFPAGVYSDIIAIKLYNNWPTLSVQLEDSVIMNINLTIPEEIALSLVSVGGSFDSSKTTHLMDFGELVEGRSLEADLIVKSNAGYSIYMQSENKGKLKHTEEANLIQYNLKVNGKRIFLGGASPKKIASKKGTTPIGGRAFRINAQIGALSSARAGTYADSITITVESKN